MGRYKVSKGFFKEPKKYFKNNVKGTDSILSSIKDTKVKNFLFSSSAAVYKDGMYRVTENSPIKPKSVYGKTKLKAENLIKSKCKKLRINYGILRYFNIVGASPSGKYGLINISDHLFKNFSTQIIKKNPVLKIYGTTVILLRELKIMVSLCVVDQTLH